MPQVLYLLFTVFRGFFAVFKSIKFGGYFWQIITGFALWFYPQLAV